MINEVARSKNEPIAKGYNFYMLFWVFVIFSILGFCFESMANLIEYGAFHNRQGILYLPFSQVYGLGAVIIIEATRWIKKKNVLFLYVFCCIFGGVFEYVVSYIEEVFLHSNTWDYSNMPFNLGGRTNLLFSLAWGFVGVAIVKFLYPQTVKIINLIRGKSGVIFTWIVLVVLAGDILLSSAMVYRAYERINNIPASNPVQVFLDKYYPDSMVKKTYPSLRFK
ncbi:MAG: putative ABC transporter permease [Erysipelotrichaceae bacterium]